MQASPHGHVLLNVSAVMPGLSLDSSWDAVPRGQPLRPCLVHPHSPGPGHQEVLTRERAEVWGCWSSCEGRQAAGLEARLQRP